MKVLTIVGTRPELIRLSRVIPLLQKHCEHVLVHTSQNYDYSLSGVFLAELGYHPGPKYILGAQGSFAQQMARIFEGLEMVLLKERPDRALILGDTNSSLGAVICARMGIEVFHAESGNRCHDKKSPEEINRKLIDHCSTIHMPYTERSRQNLLLEGIPIHKTFVVGNPIGEVMAHYGQEDRFEEVAARMKIDGPYFLSTFHRQENVDSPTRLKSIVDSLAACHKRFECQVLVSTHPRTRARLKALYGAELPKEIRFLEPMGFLDFLSLEKHARLILTDSGTCCEEAGILGVGCVVMRDSSERPEVIERGLSFLAGADSARIVAGAEIMLGRDGNFLAAPPEYLYPNVSQTVTGIVLGHLL